MPTNMLGSPLTQADTYVSKLRHALGQADYGLSEVPGWLKIILREGAWRHRVSPQMQKEVRFERFVDFLTTGPLEGLGTDLATIKRLCADDPIALDLLDAETVGRQGQHLNNVKKSTAGNGEQYALRRLRKARPDLHAQVLDGDLTPHAAMIEAGFRQRTITVVPTVESLARTLPRHLPPIELDALIKALREVLERS